MNQINSNQMNPFKPNGFLIGSKSKGNCHFDHIPFNSKGNRIRVFSVYTYLFILAAFSRDKLNSSHFLHSYQQSYISSYQQSYLYIHINIHKIYTYIYTQNLYIYIPIVSECMQFKNCTEAYAKFSIRNVPQDQEVRPTPLC